MDQEKKIVRLEKKIEELTAALNMLTKCQEAEYRRLSLDLHDELGQSLTSVLLRLKMIRGEDDWDQVKIAVTELEELVNGILMEVRRMSRFLRPIILETMGLIPALEWFTENFERQTGIRCYFKYNAERMRFPDKVETQVYRILQEALNNTAKHAQPRMVAVAVSYQQERFVLSVRDYGIGFEVNKVNTGMGLISMRERAYLLGGKLTVQSTVGKGTHIMLDFHVLDETTSVGEEE